MFVKAATVFCFVFILSLVVSPAASFTSDPQDVLGCAVCEIVVGIIKTDLWLGNKTINEVIDIVNAMCQLLGGPIIGAECQALLGAVKEIENFLVSGLEPGAICQKLNFCNATDPLASTLNLPFKRDVTTGVCWRCENLLLLVKLETAELASNSKLQSMIEQYCALQPAPVCAGVMKDVPTFISTAKSKMKDQDVCSAFNICDSE